MGKGQQATYITTEDVGRKVFCLQRVDNISDDNYAYLHVVIDEGNNETSEKIIVYNYSPEFGEFINALAEVVPVHMCGFQDGLLASASTIWGYVCPCQFDA